METLSSRLNRLGVGLFLIIQPIHAQTFAAAPALPGDAGAASRPAAETSVHMGLAASVWPSFRATYEAGRHSFFVLQFSG